MAFRYNEAVEDGRAYAMHRFIDQLPVDQRDQSRAKLNELIDRLGPVVEAYPTWHPLVAGRSNEGNLQTVPSSQCGYDGLDHTIYLRNGFITCPYGGVDRILNSVEARAKEDQKWAEIEAVPLDFPLYYDGATPVLVECIWWRGDSEADGTIASRFAVARMLELELADWADGKYGETWQTMRNYFLGRPCGARSSLFVNQETGQKMKNVWNAVLNAGVFGPVKV